jgi:hypothetical protein
MDGLLIVLGFLQAFVVEKDFPSDLGPAFAEAMRAGANLLPNLDVRDSGAPVLFQMMDVAAGFDGNGDSPDPSLVDSDLGADECAVFGVDGVHVKAGLLRKSIHAADEPRRVGVPAQGVEVLQDGRATFEPFEGEAGWHRQILHGERVCVWIAVQNDRMRR